jgi:hypothetical protein
LWRSERESQNVEDNSVDSSKLNMDALKDGQIKRRLLTLFSQWSCKYGLYFMFTAQVDDTYVENMYQPPEKQNQYMKSKDRFKGCGPQFEFLTNTLLQNLQPNPLLTADRKSPEYHSISGDNLAEINDVPVMILRCKTAPAGKKIPTLTSQNYGILSGLTYYHFLKKNDDFGFKVSGVGKTNRNPLLMPDVTLQRKNVIDSLYGNYELNRALEIMGQLKWLHLYWDTSKLGINIPKTAESFVESIINSDLTISDILNSRGWWTYDKKNERPYMSLMDILDKIQIKETKKSK